MKLWKKLTVAVLMSEAMLVAGLTAKPCLFLPAGAEITAQAADEEVTVGNLIFTKYDTYAEVKTLSKSSSTVTIPSEVDGLPVTKIGSEAFYDRTGIKKATIPDSVTSIGASAFRNCTNLTSITIPNSVTHIGNMAFYNCSGLTSVTIGDGIISIGMSAFVNTQWLTSKKAENPLVIENHYLIDGHAADGNVVIPKGTTIICDHAFSYCQGLTSITIPNSVTGIGEEAFRNCKNLKSVKIGSGVTRFGRYAFADCVVLESVKIENGSTSIGAFAFLSCKKLISITIPGSVKTIDSYAFEHCSGLTTVKLENGVKSIGEWAFNDCTNLTSITIPDSVTSIGNYAFGSCKSLTNITIPNGVNRIGNYVFSSCDSLSTVSIPDSVTSIGESAFYACTDLANITIPDSVTSIGESAFYACTDLANITIPDSVTSIGGDAFHNTPWLEAKQKENPLVVVNHILIDGKTAKGSVMIPGGVTKITRSAFSHTYSDSTGLISITIPDSVTEIGYRAFYGCISLTSVTIGSGVTSLGDEAFRRCSNLTSITIPDSVTYIAPLALPEPVSGRVRLTITGKKGSYAEQYAIENNIPFSVFGVSLSQSTLQYTGNPVKVGKYISVYEGKKKLKYETDFMLSYKNNVNCGVNTAKVIVEGIGEYAGNSVTMTYSIVPALSTQKGRLHIEWSAVNKADGYQVQYSKDPSFTGDTVHTASVTKLYCDLATYPKAGETWYVRVRSFTTTSSGGKNYGAWSGASSITLATIDNVSLKYTAFHYKDGAPVKVGKYLTVYSGDNTKLKYGKDFTLVYKNNVKRGTASVTIKGIGEYAGSSVTKTYRIV